MSGRAGKQNDWQSFDTPENKNVIGVYKAKYCAGALITDPMIHVYIWSAAVKTARE